MYMTDEQRYSAVLKELGEVLQDKNTTISCQKWQIDQLKEKLAAAEKERDEMRAEWEMTAELLEEKDEQLHIANDDIKWLLDEIDQLKGGAA